MKKRKILVILSNRFFPSEAPRYLELLCDAKGTILQQRRLRSRPATARFDEVWENDEGKRSLDDCARIKRKYSHPLQKKRG